MKNAVRILIGEINGLRFLRIAILALLTTASMNTVLADDMSPFYEEVGGWQIHVDTTIDNSCFAMAAYEGNSVFRIGFNVTLQNMYVLVGDPSWKSIEAGKSYDVGIEFGDEGKWNAEATGFSFDGETNQPYLWINVGIDNADDFLDEFMREKYVAIYYQGKDILSLKLKGSFQAGSKLLECQRNINSIQNDPFDQKNDRTDPFSRTSAPTSDPFRY